MKPELSKFEKWILHRIFKRAVIQSCSHKCNITEIYAIMHDECELQFKEDNTPTLDSFLHECFDSSQRGKSHSVVWNTIDSVPKNGQNVILGSTIQPSMVGWFDSEGDLFGNEDTGTGRFTHWTVIPNKEKE